jgi:hypothetical protein
MTRRWWRRLGESQHGGAALVAGDAKSEDGVLGDVICDVGGQGGGGSGGRRQHPRGGREGHARCVGRPGGPLFWASPK